MDKKNSNNPKELINELGPQSQTQIDSGQESKLESFVFASKEPQPLPSLHSEDYANLFHSSPVACFLLGKRGKILEANHIAAKMLNRPRETLHEFSFIQFLGQETQVIFREFLSDVFTQTGISISELQLQTSQETILDLQIQGTKFPKKENQPEICFMVCTDITAQKNLERELLQAKKRAERSEQLKGEFLANMSHEIRTPITLIMGHIELLIAEQQKSQREQKILQTVYKASRNLLVVINDILDLSRIEQKQMPFHVAPFSLFELLKSLEELFFLQAAEKKVKFTFRFEDGTPRYHLGDEERIRQVLSNIIANAIKFTPNGGQVRVIVLYRKNQLVFTVQDTGIGIPKEKLVDIFQAFKQVDGSSTRSFGGTGLGLSIAKRLLEHMNGKIHVKSTLGEGSTFIIQLPLKLSTKEEVLSSTSELRTLRAIQNTVKARGSFKVSEQVSTDILIVDDDEDLRELTSFYIEKMGYSYDFAENGLKALEKLSQGKYKLLLLDMQMPVMDGYETIKNIRKDKRFLKQKVIAITARALKGEADSCLTAGCDDYISKPFDFPILSEKVNLYLT